MKYDVSALMADVKAKNPGEAEFHQAVQEVVESLALVLDQHPEYRKAKIIEMRYFGGMTVEETAHALGISPATVNRDTSTAQLWLCREMKSGE